VVKAGWFKKASYSTIWEDERIVERGLRPQRGERVLCITSGGCFSLQCLLADVEEVVSVDASFYQTALLELKRAAAAALSHGELWAFLGLAPSTDRLRTYESLRAALPPEVAAFWDAGSGAIAGGVTVSGRRDRLLHWVGRLIAGIQGRRAVRDLLACRSLAEQRVFFQERWNNRRWRWLIDGALSGPVLRRIVNAEALGGSNGRTLAQAIRAEIEHLLCDVPVADNFYLHYLFERTYPSGALCPAWLGVDALPVVRERLGRLTCHTERIETYLVSQAPRRFDGFYLSNVLDWAAPEEADDLFAQIVRVARPGARVCYWTNTLNRPYELSADKFPTVVCDEPASAAIHERCRTPGYSSCVVATVNGKA